MQYYELAEGQSRAAEAAEPVWKDCYDVIVAGGGSSGIYCALAAAQEGKKESAAFGKE